MENVYFVMDQDGKVITLTALHEGTSAPDLGDWTLVPRLEGEEHVWSGWQFVDGEWVAPSDEPG